VITVRNVPDEVRDELAARAARSGRSLQEYLLNQLIDMASRSSFDEEIARARARVAAAPRQLNAADILAADDADHR
jgi:plasmid stability protein